MGKSWKGCENVKLSWKFVSILRVAVVLALGAALVPMLASAAHAQGTVTQNAPTTGTTTTTATISPGFSDELSATGDGSAVTFSTTLVTTPIGATNTIQIDQLTGDITSTGPLEAGNYVATGNDQDADGDTGTWTYTLTVNPVALVQGSPTSNTTPAGTPISDQLQITGGTGGPYTFSQSSGSAEVSVSSSGAVSVTDTVPVGNYSASGNVTDSLGDSTLWNYDLTVTPLTITQGTPTSGSASAGTSLHDQLSITGGVGTYNFTQSSGTPAITVSSAGAVNVPATVPVGYYTASGNVTDSLGDATTWNYDLTVNPVTITQGAPLSGSTSAGTPFSGQLTTSGGTPSYNYSQSTGSPNITVSSSGAVSTLSTDHVGDYTASGTVTDSLGDSNGWTFSLTVNPVTIAQGAPTSGTTTAVASSSFSDQLSASGNGSVTFSQTGGSGLSVTSAGVVSTTSTLTAGSYTASGTDSDSLGDTGNWTYTLTVSSSTIAQSAPTSNSTTPAASSSFTQQLATSGATGSVKFTMTGSGSTPAGVVVSSSGLVSTTGALSVGSYTVSGTDSDTYGDAGTWTYTLKVTSTAITQESPFANTKTITAATSASFTDKLKTTGNTGSVKYVTTGSGSTPSGILVSSSGVVSTKRALAAGTYTISGTDSDTANDSGSWSYSLTVTATKITQAAPTSATARTGKAFTDQLKVSGSYGTVTYLQSSGSSDIKVSASGVVSTSATLRAGTYKAKGTVSDSYRDVRGTWSFTLTISAAHLAQGAPDAGTTTAGKAFSDQLKVSGSYGTVTYSQSSGLPDLRVSSSGVVSATDTLRAGTYKAAGTVSDSVGDTGSWSYTLTVAANKPSPISPDSAIAAIGTAFTVQLKLAGSKGTVTFTQSSGAPDLKVSSSGMVSAPASLPAGTYNATGTARDTHGDAGTWSFTLTVTSKQLTQIAPTSARTTTGTAFTAQLQVSGSQGAVTYTQSSGAPELKISSSGAVSAPSTLSPGIYNASGTSKDSHGEVGTWSFTLTVVAGRLSQAAPAAGTTLVGTPYSGQLKVSDSHGVVTYTQSAGAPQLKVSSTGAVSALGTLPAATYKAAGTSKDSHGDLGTWSFTLTVTAVRLSQAAPAKASTLVGRAFTGQLKVADSHGVVTYTQSAGAPELQVSSTGAVSALGTLPAGTYKAAGATRDSYGDTGSWNFALAVAAVRLSQAHPAKGNTLVGRAFTGQLKVADSHGVVTYTQSAGAPELQVTSAGKVSAPSTLLAGTYKAAGATRDSYGDTGNWSFTLKVAARKLAQIAPITGVVAAGKAFATEIKFSGPLGTVTFSQSTGAPQLKITSAGALSAAANLAAGTYKAAGSARDRFGDTGAWSFSLTVTGVKLIQLAPLKAKTGAGSVFSEQLKVSGSKGAVTYTESKGAPHLKVSPSGKISAPDTLRPGTYKATGSERDSLGDTGTWSFSLIVRPTKLKQTAPLTGIVTAGKTFTTQLQFAGPHGKLTYIQSSGNQSLIVSSSGKVTAPNSLAAGTYEVFGIAKDSVGDTGTWTFTLTVQGF